MKSVTPHGVAVVSVVLGVLLGLLVIIPTPAFSTAVPDIEILYVAANNIYREIFCKLRGNGTVTSTVYEVRVNGTIVTTGDPLPITLKKAEYKTYVFRYDGPWEGSILITFICPTMGAVEGRSIQVDLQTISRNPIEGAYPSTVERVENFLILHPGYWLLAEVFIVSVIGVVVLMALIRGFRRHFATLIREWGRGWGKLEVLVSAAIGVPFFYLGASLFLRILLASAMALLAPEEEPFLAFGSPSGFPYVQSIGVGEYSILPSQISRGTLPFSCVLLLLAYVLFRGLAAALMCVEPKVASWGSGRVKVAVRPSILVFSIVLGVLSGLVLIDIYESYRLSFYYRNVGVSIYWVVVAVMAVIILLVLRSPIWGRWFKVPLCIVLSTEITALMIWLLFVPPFSFLVSPPQPFVETPLGIAAVTGAILGAVTLIVMVMRRRR